jgi:hypothetical protein
MIVIKNNPLECLAAFAIVLVAAAISTIAMGEYVRAIKRRSLHPPRWI